MRAKATRLILHAAAQVRTGPMRAVPIPCRLPHGGWFLTYGDEIGVTVLSQAVGLGSFEAAEYRFVAQFVKSGMTCLDIGANQGIYTILLCRRAGSSGRVVAFEPIPFLTKRLHNNLMINRCPSYTIEQIAVGREEAMSEFHIALDGRESYSALGPSSDDRSTTLIVPVTTLDKYLEREYLKRVDFIKIDAEGAELHILEGGKHLLEEMRPTLLCEIADVRTRSFGYAAEMIYSFLEQRSYRWFEVDQRGLLRPSPKRESYEPDWANLVAVPEEKLADVSALRSPAP